MRKVLRGAAALLAVLSPFAFAQAYPDKPIRVIVPVPAGGTPDVVARMVTPGLSNLLGQQLVVDNRGGAGGLIGAEMAAGRFPMFTRCSSSARGRWSSCRNCKSTLITTRCAISHL